MDGPRQNSRKGRMERALMLARNMGRDWRPYNGKWQPSADLRRVTLRRIQELREELGRLEQSL